MTTHEQKLKECAEEILAGADHGSVRWHGLRPDGEYGWQHRGPAEITTILARHFPAPADVKLPPMKCPHCQSGLLWSEDRGPHCDGCDDFNPETDISAPADVNQRLVEAAKNAWHGLNIKPNAYEQIVKWRRELWAAIGAAEALAATAPAKMEAELAEALRDCTADHATHPNCGGSCECCRVLARYDAAHGGPSQPKP